MPVSYHFISFDVGEYPYEFQRVAGPRNCEVAVGISLLSCMQAEIFVIANVLLVNGGHLEVDLQTCLKPVELSFVDTL